MRNSPALFAGHCFRYDASDTPTGIFPCSLTSLRDTVTAYDFVRSMRLDLE